MRQVSVAVDGTMWGCPPRANAVFVRLAGRDAQWAKLLEGELEHVAVSGDGRHVWGIDRGGAVFYRDGRLPPPTGAWDTIEVPGRLQWLAVSGDGGAVWGVSKKHEIYCRAGRHATWKRVEGRLCQLAVSGDGANVWGVNKKREVFRRCCTRTAAPVGGWERMEGCSLTHVALAVGAALRGGKGGTIVPVTQVEVVPVRMSTLSLPSVSAHVYPGRSILCRETFYTRRHLLRGETHDCPHCYVLYWMASQECGSGFLRKKPGYGVADPPAAHPPLPAHPAWRDLQMRLVSKD